MKKAAKFGDMPAGTIFNDGSRTFVKFKTTYASGAKMKCYHTLADGKGAILPFNSIDSDGCPANCPDWVIFKLGAYES